MWKSITDGKSLYVTNNSKATSIRNPVFLYIQRVMAFSLFYRENNSGVTSGEIFALHCMATSTNINVGAYLIEQFDSQANVAIGSIGIGGFITPIVDHFHIGNHHKEEQGQNRVDIEGLKHMTMLDHCSDRYLLVQRNLKPFPLPNKALTSILIKDNWLMDTPLHKKVTQEVHDAMNPSQPGPSNAIIVSTTHEPSPPPKTSQKANASNGQTSATTQEEQIASLTNKLNEMQSANETRHAAMEATLRDRQAILVHELGILRENYALLRSDTTALREYVQTMQGQINRMHEMMEQMHARAWLPNPPSH